MEKNTLLAVVLSVIVITGGFVIQNMLYPPQPATDAAVSTPVEQPASNDSNAVTPENDASSGRTAIQPSSQQTIGNPIRPVPEENLSREPVVFENDLLRVVFDPAGARVVSYQLLDHLDGGEPVEMVMQGDTDIGAFELHFGGADAAPVRDLFRRVDSTDSSTITFARDFYVEGSPGQPFTVLRSYRFLPGEYVVETAVEIQNSVNALIPLNFNGAAYTISFGPQIGPSYEELDNRQEYRNFYYFDGDRRRNIRMRGEDREVITERVQWTALAGKYFAVIAVPGAADPVWTLSTIRPEGLRDGASLSLTRPPISSAANRDIYRFYVGPKVGRVLERYNDADENAFGLRNLEFQEVQDSRVLFGWLENILKWAMQLIYQIVPNYGAAIIILTILVKVLLWPLTHKSYESTSRMQELNPKIQEIREKFKDNPQKMNQAMADLYKKEGVNPLGGCLPLGLQFPFFIAMFGVFNNHFDLRGATFIPGWITDLAAPESILNFGDFVVPFLGWNDLRLLPILFVGSQLLSSRLMQNPAAGTSNSQMKMMQYGMPIMFFFILYNMPSGLLVYWISSNILTVAQQYFISQRRKHHTTE
jgi:YidC/Oxa1 family membrane protein insertase